MRQTQVRLTTLPATDGTPSSALAILLDNPTTIKQIDGTWCDACQLHHVGWKYIEVYITGFWHTVGRYDDLVAFPTPQQADLSTARLKGVLVSLADGTSVLLQPYADLSAQVYYIPNSKED